MPTEDDYLAFQSAMEEVLRQPRFKALCLALADEDDMHGTFARVSLDITDAAGIAAQDH